MGGGERVLGTHSKNNDSSAIKVSQERDQDPTTSGSKVTTTTNTLHAHPQIPRIELAHHYIHLARQYSRASKHEHTRINVFKALAFLGFTIPGAVLPNEEVKVVEWGT